MASACPCLSPVWPNALASSLPCMLQQASSHVSRPRPCTARQPTHHSATCIEPCSHIPSHTRPYMAPTDHVHAQACHACTQLIPLALSNHASPVPSSTPYYSLSRSPFPKPSSRTRPFLITTYRRSLLPLCAQLLHEFRSVRPAYPFSAPADSSLDVLPHARRVIQSLFQLSPIPAPGYPLTSSVAYCPRAHQLAVPTAQLAPVASCLSSQLPLL